MREWFYKITDYFDNLSDRMKLIRGFNKASKKAFAEGWAPTLLLASATKGDREYKHQFSSFFNSGFIVKVLSGSPMTKGEMIKAGEVILSDQLIVRQLITLGFDTLLVHDDSGYNGCKWPLKKYANIGGYLN